MTKLKNFLSWKSLCLFDSRMAGAPRPGLGHETMQADQQSTSIMLDYLSHGDMTRAVEGLAYNLILGKRELVDKQAVIPAAYFIKDGQLYAKDGTSFQNLIDPSDTRRVENFERLHPMFLDQLLTMQKLFCTDPSVVQVTVASPASLPPPEGRSYLYVYEKTPEGITLKAVEASANQKRFANLLNNLGDSHPIPLPEPDTRNLYELIVVTETQGKKLSLATIIEETYRTHQDDPEAGKDLLKRLTGYSEQTLKEQQREIDALVTKLTKEIFSSPPEERMEALIKAAAREAHEINKEILSTHSLTLRESTHKVPLDGEGERISARSHSLMPTREGREILINNSEAFHEKIKDSSARPDVTLTENHLLEATSHQRGSSIPPGYEQSAHAQLPEKVVLSLSVPRTSAIPLPLDQLPQSSEKTHGTAQFSAAYEMPGHEIVSARSSTPNKEMLSQNNAGLLRLPDSLLRELGIPLTAFTPTRSVRSEAEKVPTPPLVPPREHNFPRAFAPSPHRNSVIYSSSLWKQKTATLQRTFELTQTGAPPPASPLGILLRSPARAASTKLSTRVLKAAQEKFTVLRKKLSASDTLRSSPLPSLRERLPGKSQRTDREEISSLSAARKRTIQQHMMRVQKRELGKLINALSRKDPKSVSHLKLMRKLQQEFRRISPKSAQISFRVLRKQFTALVRTSVRLSGKTAVSSAIKRVARFLAALEKNSRQGGSLKNVSREFSITQRIALLLGTAAALKHAKLPAPLLRQVRRQLLRHYYEISLELFRRSAQGGESSFEEWEELLTSFADILQYTDTRRVRKRGKERSARFALRYSGEDSRRLARERKREETPRQEVALSSGTKKEASFSKSASSKAALKARDTFASPQALLSIFRLEVDDADFLNTLPGSRGSLCTSSPGV